MFSTIDVNNVLFLNLLANSNSFWHTTALFLSSYLIYFLPLIPIVRFFITKSSMEKSDDMKALTWALVTVIFALAIGFLFEGAIGRHRPFEAISEIKTIGNLPGNTSFPSMHGLVVFSFALSYLVREKYYQMGLWLFLGAILVVTGRMMCGFHYPTDLIGSFIIGAFSAFVLVYEGSPLFKWISKRGTHPSST